MVLDITANHWVIYLTYIYIKDTYIYNIQFIMTIFHKNINHKFDFFNICIYNFKNLYLKFIIKLKLI